MTTYGSLCTGIAGLDRAVESVFGAEMIWCAEVDKDACRALERHYPGVPNLGDISRVDWSAVVSPDVLCAGPPCQPVSVAGKREGEDDERWLWPDVLRAVERLRPRWLVLENPPGIAPWLPAILRRLAALGYVGRFGRLAAGRADDDRRLHVAACHQRERVFVVADASSEPGRLQPVGQSWCDGAAAVADAGARPAADPDGEGRSEIERGSRAGTGRGGAAADADRFGREEPPHLGRVEADMELGAGWSWYDAERDIDYGPAIARHERAFGRPAPWPVVAGTRSLSGDFTAWMMDVPEGWLNGISNTAKKRLCGNAVVARQAELALRALVAR